MQKNSSKSKNRTAGASKAKGARMNATLFERGEILLAKYLDRIFWISMVVTFIFGVLLFDVRFSISGDDSAYVLRAHDFIHHFVFPEFQGPLYPIVLSPFVALFGLSAIPLKCLSLLFILGSVYFFYVSFKDRIPVLLLTSILILLPVNSFILYYGSQTYSEGFFMFLQAFTFSLFFAFFVANEDEKPQGSMWKHHLLFACCLLCLGLTRSIGFSAVSAAGAFFILKAQWRNLLFFAGSFILVFLAYQAFRFVLPGHAALQFGDQLQGLAAKDYYNPALGHESFMGFVDRFLVNSNYYLSKALFTVMGLVASNDTEGKNPLLAVGVCLVIISAAVVAYRKNSYLLFTGLYVIITLSITFFIAHTIWLQSRFIIPYYPVIMLLLISSVYYLLCRNRWTKFQVVLPVFIVILFGYSLLVTANQVRETRKIDSKYYGLTPDWENYCRLSEWTARNLPGNAVIACRKPSISFIYSGGKKFFGITRLPYASGDSLIMDWKRRNLNYYLTRASALNNKPVTEKIYREFTKGIVAYGINTRNKFIEANFFVLNFPGVTGEEALRDLNSINIKITNRVDSLEAWLSGPDSEILMIYPDSALMLLMKAKVTHVITDNIRSYPDRKNSQTLTTVERFMNFIEAKYPGIRTKVIQMGANENEPATLYEFNYSRAGLNGTK